MGRSDCLSPFSGSGSKTQKTFGLVSNEKSTKMASFLSSVVEMIVPKLKAEEEDDEPAEEEEEEEEEEDEEELVDSQEVIRDKCKESHCVAAQKELDACNDRVNSKTATTETCFQEILDFYHCIDHCASATVMSQLK